jgi:hypothetical protein
MPFSPSFEGRERPENHMLFFSPALKDWAIHAILFMKIITISKSRSNIKEHELNNFPILDISGMTAMQEPFSEFVKILVALIYLRIESYYVN